jgi:hypothetical protein
VKHLSFLLALTLQAPLIPPKSAPADLVRLIGEAHMDAPVAWCRGAFRPGGPPGYAAAVTNSTDGRYVVLQAGMPALELASFVVGTADLSCYTPARARRLTEDIRASGIIHGSVAPRWTTTVICGFTDATTSVCWQYSPGERKFVRVGGWIT